MSGLIRAEVRRLLARRVVHLLALLVVVGAVTAGSVLFVKSHRLGPGGQRSAQQAALAHRDEQVASCVRGEFGIRQKDVPQGMTLRQFCEQVVVPPPKTVDPAFHLTHLKDVFSATNVILILLLTLVAASFVGAEWHAGSMATWLTWEPRRIRVFATKALTAALFAFVAFLVAQALIGLALTPAAVVRGTTAGVEGAWVRSVAGLELRAAAVAGMAALVGFSIASLGRNTAVAVGAAFAYIAVLEPILRAVRPSLEPWLVYDNAGTFITGGPATFTQFPRSVLGSAVLLAVYSVGLAAVALTAFRVRDVT